MMIICGHALKHARSTHPDFAAPPIVRRQATDRRPRPTEYRADAVVVLWSGATAVFAVIVEVQLGRDGGVRALDRRSLD